MPIMDGLQVLQRLDQDKLDKVIMISAMGDMDLLKQAKEYGVRFFLNKPFQPDDVIHAINGIITRER